MNDTPGTPSAICVGHHPAKGEAWVSPGVGERMIAYLRRTYAQPAPAERPKRAHLKLRPDPHGTITARTSRQVRCADCQHAYELEREQVQRDQRRGGTDHCRQCGAPLGDVHANLRFCSDACRRAHKAAYNAAYKAALRGGPHDG